MSRQERIVLLDGFTLNPGDLDWSGFEALGALEVYDRTPSDKIVERIGDAAIVVTNKTPIDSKVLDACPNIRYIGVLATGYNVVDVAAASARGIVVTNIPTYGTTAVAQYVFALLLELCHHVGEHSKAVKAGRWAASEDFCFWDYPLIELAGKTMGIIGLGRIGRSTARIASALGMRVLAFDAYEDPSAAAEGIVYAQLDDVLRNADVISLHCPLTDQTKGMVNRQSISRMKDGVLIINTSRGPLIVEKDLAEALDSGKVGGAAVDVVATEPPATDNPLIASETCIVTPHIAWDPRESRKRLMDIAVDNLAVFLQGKEVKNAVHP